MPDVSAPTSNAPADEPSDRYSVLEAIKDNVEAFVIALVLALIIKHFCVEAFKIPTGSMSPTLYGDTNAPTGEGDRIVVNKWAYLTGEPERYDVIVFRYPLNKAKHFIKRVAGIGPEWLVIHEGDVWTRATPSHAWQISRKRRAVREQLYVPVYPPARSDLREDETPEQATERLLDLQWESAPGWRLADLDDFSFDGSHASDLILRRRIGSRSQASDPSQGPGRMAGDVRFRMTVRAAEGAMVTLVWRTEDGETRTCRLATPGAPEASMLRVERLRFDERAAVDVRLTPDQDVDVEWECVDGELILHVGGHEVARLDEQAQMEDTADWGGEGQRFRIAAEGGALRVTGLRIDRDIWYVNEGANMPSGDEGLWVPDGRLFMLGDNTISSSDSRKWTLQCVTLKNGRRICYESNNNDLDYLEGDRKTVTDSEGVRRTWHEDDEAVRARSVRSPFVDRDLVVGRAFFVFWPVLPEFPGRMGFFR